MSEELSPDTSVHDLKEPPEEIKNNLHIYYEHYDEEYTRSLFKLMEPIRSLWFRSKFIGFENFPKRNNPERPLIFACNHSGMAFPWDAIVMGYEILKHFDFGPDAVRVLTSPMLSWSALMNPFTIHNLWKRVGGIDATFQNFETMMYYKDHNVLVYPEGVPGIGKGFDKKYQLQEFKTSFIRMSVKYKTDIVGISTINGEYINPWAYSSKFVNRLMNKIGIPFLPLGFITPFILLQPWLFYFGFPAKLIFVLGRRFKPYEMFDKPYEKISQEEFRKAAAKIRDLMQEDMDKAVEEYGKKPYNLKEFFLNIIKNFKKLPLYLPTSWPILFTDHHKEFVIKGNRQYKQKAGFFRNFWLMIKNPITFAYFIPILGWIPIAIKGYRDNKIDKNKTIY